MFTKKEITLIILVLAILLLGFYWYSLRPYFAKQDCLKQAENFSRSGGQSFEQAYDHCMLKKGYK